MLLLLEEISDKIDLPADSGILIPVQIIKKSRNAVHTGGSCESKQIHKIGLRGEK
jgi:hypothetical protein